MPSDVILEGLYKSKLEKSVQLRTVMALYDQEVARNNGASNYQQLKTAVKLHNDQMMRNTNFKVRSDVVERRSVTKSRKGNKAHVGRKIRECFQWKAHGQCSKGDSCSFSHDPSPLETRAKVRDEKDDRLLPHPTRRQSGLTARNIKPHRDQAINKKNSSDKRSEIPCRIKFCKNLSCGFWQPPACLNNKSEKIVYMATNAVSDMLRQMESPTISRKRVVREDQLQ